MGWLLALDIKTSVTRTICLVLNVMQILKLKICGQLDMFFLLPRFAQSDNFHPFKMSIGVTAAIENTSDFATTLSSYQSYEMTSENVTWFATTLTSVMRTLGQETFRWPYLVAKSDEIIMVLNLYITPILLFVGTAGNILSFVIFSRPALKQSATALYFRCLAVADTLALNNGLWPSWMHDAFGIDIYPVTDVSCRIQTYLRYTLPDCAVWVLVIMAIERMVGVQWPHRVHDIFTRRRIRFSVFIMVIVVALINIPALWIATKNDGSVSLHTCTVANDELAYQIWPWVDLTIYSLLPFTIMTGCSIVIIKTVYRRRRRLSRQCSVNGNTGSNVKTMTTILLTVTFVFLFLTIPFTIYAITRDELYGEVNVDYHLFYAFARILRYVNNSVNFVLYCLSGKPFRVELMHLLRGRKRPLTRYSSSTTDVTYVGPGRDTIKSHTRHEPGSPLGSPGFTELQELPYPK